jgi:hypothetical protein
MYTSGIVISEIVRSIDDNAMAEEAKQSSFQQIRVFYRVCLDGTFLPAMCMIIFENLIMQASRPCAYIRNKIPSKLVMDTWE